MKKRDKAIIIAALLALTISFYPGEINLLTQNKVSEPSSTSSVLIKEVVDGDTAKAEINGELRSIRFLGIDTPELKGEEDPEEYREITNETCLKLWAEKASNYTDQKLSGREVKLFYDEKAGDEGYYGRLLRYIELNGTDFNLKLIEEGYARVYDESEFYKKEDYLEAELEAFENREGLWECK